MTRRPRIVITLGDPCGIGPELLLASLHAINRWADVLVVGARAGVDLLEPRGENGQRVFWRWGEPALEVPFVKACAILGLWTSTTPRWEDKKTGLFGYASWIDPTPEVGTEALTLGQGSAASGRCAAEAVRVGAQLVLDGHADALVTLPLAKAAAHLAGYTFPGHTEFLQELSGAPLTRMAFVSPSLSVVLHTVHQSLRSVLDSLSVDTVAETLAFSADRFIQLTGKLDLKVALCALNPHAGEAGAFGDEEVLLSEAIVQAEASFLDFSGGGATPFANLLSPFEPGPAPEGWSIFPAKPSQSVPLLGGQRDIEVISSGPKHAPITRPAPRFFGPMPADTLFLRASRGEFDLVVALYHDQGLIPMKVLEPARAVNLTLGLPFIRTSPDHGTAFELAGRWAADPTNFLEATALAVRLAGRAKREPWDAEVNTPGIRHT